LLSNTLRQYHLLLAFFELLTKQNLIFENVIT
jgi:hypothetical protein